MASAEKSDGEKCQRALVRGAAVDFLVHGAKAIDHQRGIELMDGLADRGLDGSGGSGDPHVHLHAGRMLSLQIRPIHCRAHIGAQVGMLDVAHHAHDR